MIKKLSFDPKEWAEKEIKMLSDAVNECDGDKAITMSSLASGHVESAFYEKQIDEEEMDEMKKKIDASIYLFRDKCKCIAKSIKPSHEDIDISEVREPKREQEEPGTMRYFRLKRKRKKHISI